MCTLGTKTKNTQLFFQGRHAQKKFLNKSGKTYRGIQVKQKKNIHTYIYITAYLSFVVLHSVDRLC